MVLKEDMLKFTLDVVTSESFTRKMDFIIVGMLGCDWCWSSCCTWYQRDSLPFVSMRKDGYVTDTYPSTYIDAQFRLFFEEYISLKTALLTMIDDEKDYLSIR